MSSPPFNPNEAVPGDTDVVSLFPALERTFREIIESWILFEHGRSGHHAFLSLTTSERDAITDWEVGSVVYNETLAKFQLVTSIGPVVWVSIGPATEFAAATRMMFQQTSAPTGWTKESDAAYNDALPVGTTGSVATSGATAAATVLAARTIAQVNLPNYNLSIAGLSITNGTSVIRGTLSTSLVNSGSAFGALLNTLTENTLSLTGTLPSGGSGTAMDFNVKRFGVIVAQKA